MSHQSPIAGPLRRGVLVLLVSVFVAAGWVGFRAWASWHALERLAFDPAEARRSLDETRTTATTLPDADGTIPPRAPDPFDDILGFLMVGSDRELETDLSRRADVILMFVIPPDGADPLLFSLPRDLYLPDPCTGGMSRINASLNGCGDRVSGPEQLAVVVEDFTGIGVDHFAVLDFDGFRTVVDRVGGVEICVDRQVRDRRARLQLPAGCTRANGAQALAWVRSRHTQELVDGFWRLMPGVNDLTRNERQQELVLQALTRLKGFRTLSELSALVDDLAEAFVIDDRLNLSDVVSFAWTLRSIDTDRIVRLVIPTTGFLAPNGEAVLRPTEPFADTLRAAHPDADLILSP